MSRQNRRIGEEHTREGLRGRTDQTRGVPPATPTKVVFEPLAPITLARVDRVRNGGAGTAARAARTTLIPDIVPALLRRQPTLDIDPRRRIMKSIGNGRDSGGAGTSPKRGDAPGPVPPPRNHRDC